MKLLKHLRPELLVSTDTTRQPICHCYLRGPILWATDGVRIGRFPVELQEGDVDGTIPTNVLVEAREHAGKKETHIEIACAKDTLTFTSRFGLITVPRPEIGFVNAENIDDIIGAEPKPGRFATALNANLLTGLADAFGARSFRISFDDDQSPVCFEPVSGLPSRVAPDGPTMHAVLMPIRLFPELFQ